MHQAGDILYTNRQISKNLENSNRFCDVLMKVAVRKANEDLPYGLMH